MPTTYHGRLFGMRQVLVFEPEAAIAEQSGRFDHGMRFSDGELYPFKLGDWPAKRFAFLDVLHRLVEGLSGGAETHQRNNGTGIVKPRHDDAKSLPLFANEMIARYPHMVHTQVPRARDWSQYSAGQYGSHRPRQSVRHRH